MEKKGYLIDEIAQKTGLTRRTIRYYEEQGLLIPTTRTESGYRVYNDAEVRRLDKIVELRDTTGFSLKDIKEILEVEDSLEEIRQQFRREELPQVKKEILKQFREKLLRFMEIIEAKKVRLENIQSMYQAKLERVDKFLQEME